MSKPYTALVIPADRELPCYHTVIESFRDLQGKVGGTFDMVVANVVDDDFNPVNIDIWVNDEGLIWQMPQNQRAEWLAGKHLVGDAVVSGEPTAEGESTSVPDFLLARLDLMNAINS